MKSRCHISGIYLVYDRYVVYLSLYRTSNSSKMPYTWYIPLISLLFVHFQDFVDSITVAPMDQEKIQQALTGDRNFSIACELGVHYPVLKAMLSSKDQHICTSVSHSYLWFMSFFYWYYTWYIYCIYIVYVEIIQSYV